jgi:hypothetical protein
MKNWYHTLSYSTLKHQSAYSKVLAGTVAHVDATFFTCNDSYNNILKSSAPLVAHAAYEDETCGTVLHVYM